VQADDLPEALERAVRMLFGGPVASRGARFARVSPGQAEAAGWTRTGGVGKVGARWEHVTGWWLEHCGHPTANYPWALYSPAGEMVLTGAVYGEPPDPRQGRAWPNLAMPMAYVTRLAVASQPPVPVRPEPRAPPTIPVEAAHGPRPQAPEGFLFDLTTKGKEGPRCRLCGMKFKAGRCWICDKGEIPRPGSKRYHAWTRGLMRTVRDRLDAVGLGHLLSDTLRAMLLEDTPVPAAAAPLLGDILALPMSPKRYQRLEERALLQDQAYRALRARGVAPDEADKIADETADKIMRTRHGGAAP
jgi:hypothetical protein